MSGDGRTAQREVGSRLCGIFQSKVKNLYIILCSMGSYQSVLNRGGMVPELRAERSALLGEHVSCKTVRKKEDRPDYCSHTGEKTVAFVSVDWWQWRWREMSRFELYFRGRKGRAQGRLVGDGEPGEWQKGH